MDTTKSNKQYLYLNGRMDYEMINSFLNFYNSLSSETNESKIYDALYKVTKRVNNL